MTVIPPPSPTRGWTSSRREQASIEGRRVVLLVLDLGGIVPLDGEVAQLSRAAALRFEALGCRC